MSVRVFNLIFFMTFLLSFPLSAHATKTTIPYKAMTLNGNLQMAEGKSLEDGIILITHGTLAHNKMEIIATLQGLLTERGFNTLAINLSLGVDNRHGMYDCAVTHTHRHTDAVHEIAAWVTWLKNQGGHKILLAGHSRGGNQTARYMVESKVPKVLGAALIAPSLWNKEAAANSYKDRYKVSLTSLLGKMNRAIVGKKEDTIFDKLGFIYCPESTVTAASFISYYCEDKFLDTPTVLVRVKLPVLVIAGSQDTIVKGLPERMVGVVNQKIKLWVVDGAGHFFLDFYIEDAVDQIADFAGELLK
jgi:pimeloyl-ACP methyl ester carboxylesterase